jgi:glycine betaine/choline ABC-type transport system substrate-binding protein
VKEKVVSIKIAEAKGADGKVVADLTGKTLKVTGAKVADVEKLAGKEVQVKGTVKGTDIDVTMVAEVKAPVAPPAAAK